MTFSESLASATKSGLCTVISGFGAYARMHDRVFGKIDPLPSWANYWKALNRQLCNKDQPGGDDPWSGGGCDGVAYKITSVIQTYPSSACSPFLPSPRVNTLYGPIRAVYIAPDPTPISPTRWSYYITARQTPTGPIVTDSYHAFSNPQLGNCPDPRLIDVDVVRLDGSPNQECDEQILPPPPPPPGWNNIVINNFTWINNNGDVINEGDLNLEFGFAYLSADFDIEIPVKVDVGGINFNGTFNFDKGAFEIDFSRDVVNNININLRRPDGDDRDLPDPLPDNPERPDDIEDDPDIIEDDEDDDAEEEGESRILAVRVVVSSVDNKSIGVFIQNKNPDIAIPNYGYIQFFIPTFDGEGAWSEDIPVKNANAFITCPWPDGATKVRGTPRAGVLWAIQALRANISTKIVFP